MDESSSTALAQMQPGLGSPPVADGDPEARRAGLSQDLYRTVLLFTPESDGSEVPFFCVASVSGDATGYRPLSIELGPRFPFFGIQTPYPERRGNYIGSIESIARRYVEAIDWPNGPFVLGGWSSGGTIALEMAQQLRALGRNDFFLIAIDSPLARIGSAEIGPLDYSWRLLRNLPSAILHHEIWRAPQPLRTFAKRLKNKLTRNLETGGMNLSRYSADEQAYIKDLVAALAAYTPRPYAGPVAFCVTSIGPVTHLPQRREAWESVAPHGRCITLKGTHLSIMLQNFPKLAEILRHEITTFGASVRTPSPRLRTKPAGFEIPA